jgi:hypothetical protein
MVVERRSWSADILYSRGSRSRVVAKFAESGDLVFTSMGVVLFGLSLLEADF